MVRIAKYFSSLCCILFFYAAGAQDTLIEQPPVEEAPVVVAPSESYDSESTSGYYDRKEFGYFDSIPKFGERQLSKEAVSKVRDDEAYWYANADLEPKKKEKKKEFIVE